MLQTHLDHLERPLRYATRQNFAHLAKLRDLEAYVQHHVQALQASPLPPGLLPLLQQLLQAVQDVDALPLPQKQERVRQAEQVLAQMRAVPPTLPSRPLPPAVQAPVQATTRPVVQESQDKSDPCAQSVQFLRGVGPRRAALLAKMSLHTVHDLLWCLPMRYEDRRQLTPLGLLRWGKRETFCGTVTTLQTQPSKKRGKPFVALLLQDDSGALICKWFQTRSTYLQERFPVGTRRAAVW